MDATEHFEELGEFLGETREAKIGSMFGKRSIFVNKTACIALFQNELVFKLAQSRVDELVKRHDRAQNWDPSGKGMGMKEWLQVPLDHSELYGGLADEACDFVES